MGMYDTRSRGMANRNAWDLQGAQTAMNSQAAPHAAFSAGAGMYAGAGELGQQQNRATGMLKEAQGQMQDQYNAMAKSEEDAYKEAKADWKWGVEQANKGYNPLGAAGARNQLRSSGFDPWGRGQGSLVPDGGMGYPDERMAQDMQWARQTLEGRGMKLNPLGAGTFGDHAREYQSFGGRAGAFDNPSFGGRGLGMQAQMNPDYFQQEYNDGGVLGSYATGTPWVPETGVYQLHEGEAVIPKERNPYAQPVYGRRGGIGAAVESALRQRDGGFVAPMAGALPDGASQTRYRGPRPQQQNNGMGGLLDSVAGLSDMGYDTSGLYDRNGGLSGQGQAFANAWQYGLAQGADPGALGQWAASVSGLAPRKQVKQAAQSGFDVPNGVLSGLADSGFDTSELWGQDNGLSPRGSAFARMYQETGDASAAARAAGLGTVKADKPEKVDNSALVQFWNPSADDVEGKERLNNAAEAMVEDAGIDGIKAGLWEDIPATKDKLAQRNYTAKFNKLISKIQRGVASGKSDEEIFAAATKGMALTPERQKQALEEAAAQTKADNEAKGALDAQTKANAQAQLQAWQDAENARVAAERKPFARIAMGDAGRPNRLKNKPGIPEQSNTQMPLKGRDGNDPFAGMTNAQIRQMYSFDSGEPGQASLPSGSTPRFGDDPSRFSVAQRRKFADMTHPEYQGNERYASREAIAIPAQPGNALRWRGQAKNDPNMMVSGTFKRYALEHPELVQAGTQSRLANGYKPIVAQQEEAPQGRMWSRTPQAEDMMANAKQFIAENPTDPRAVEMQQLFDRANANPSSQAPQPDTKRSINAQYEHLLPPPVEAPKEQGLYRPPSGWPKYIDDKLRGAIPSLIAPSNIPSGIPGFGWR